MLFSLKAAKHCAASSANKVFLYRLKASVKTASDPAMDLGPWTMNLYPSTLDRASWTLPIL
jgi:hypothetical protein